MSVTTKTVTSTVGLEISGMTSADLAGPDAASEALDALERHGVLVYRGVDISDEDLLALSRRLGTVVVQPTGEHRYPEIQTITMDPTKTNAIMASYRHGNFHWHLDGAMDEIPQKATLLTARAVDPAGGDTELANTYAAHAALSESERAEIADLRVVHSFAHAQSLANPETHGQGACGLGPDPHPGASVGVEAPRRAHVPAGGCDGSRGSGMAPQERTKGAGSAIGLVHPNPVHPAAEVAHG
jgi:alpha-ketoglutarate-dependent taurine dioxygenase